MAQRSLLVVPTNGSFRNQFNQLMPSVTGMIRLDRAADVLRGDPKLRLVICGGKRRNPNSSEVVVAARYFSKKFPELKNRLIFRRAKSTYTPAIWLI